MGYHIQECISESQYGFPCCGGEPASSQDLTSELQASALTPKQMGLPHGKT